MREELNKHGELIGNIEMIGGQPGYNWSIDPAANGGGGRELLTWYSRGYARYELGIRAKY